MMLRSWEQKSNAYQYRFDRRESAVRSSQLKCNAKQTVMQCNAIPFHFNSSDVARSMARNWIKQIPGSICCLQQVASNWTGCLRTLGSDHEYWWADNWQDKSRQRIHWYSPSQMTTGQDRIGQDRTGQDRQARGQNRTGQGRTGQDRTDRTGQGQDRTGQDRTGQDRTWQDRTW